MQIALIAAIGENGVIGFNNKLPWHIPEELKYFKSQTLGKPVIMGRKTFESMGNKPLPQRNNIVLTTDKHFCPPNCTIVHSIQDALKVVQADEEVMVIGGSEIFKAFLPIAHKLYLSFIHQAVIGDVYFPSINWEQWEMVFEQVHEKFTSKVFTKRVY